MFGFMNIVCRSVGGLASDVIGKKTGMRGRIWVLWVLQTLEGVACIAMGLAYKSLALTIVLMLVFSFFVQASEVTTRPAAIAMLLRSHGPFQLR